MESPACFQKSCFLEERNGIHHGGKNKIKAEYAKRHRKANKPEKPKNLDECLKLLGKGNRKYAIFALNREGKKQLRLIDGKYANAEISTKTRRKPTYKPYYDDEAAEVLAANPGSFSGISAGSGCRRF
jgi:hypothetical protein